MNSLPLNNRVAIVTGAAQGIGHAIAVSLGEAGASVALCDIAPLDAEMQAELLAGMPTPSAYFECDISNAVAVEAMTKAVYEQLGGLHILINNAGVAIDGLLLRAKPEQWEQVLKVNLGGAFNCAKAAVRHLLKAKDKGRIVNISSVVGERGNAGQVAYSASKAGLLGVTKTLAQELASRGVTVNAVSPGFIETQMTRDHVQGKQREQLLSAIPLRRIGSPEDVAETVCFLCTDAAAYITGQVIRVNGGLYM